MPASSRYVVLLEYFSINNEHGFERLLATLLLTVRPLSLSVQHTSVPYPVFQRWKKEHPDWRVVEGASPAFGGMPLIRVPEVTIAGHTVGPVWFEQRPDRMFHRTLSASTDRPVPGALGGSPFQHFRITVDYPGARASFQRLD